MNTRITEFDRPICQLVGNEAQLALKAVAEKYGLVVTRKPGRFDADSYSIGFTFAVQTESGVPADFARLAPLVGLTPEDHGRVFSVSGEEYRIKGIDLKRRKYPIGVERVRDGRGFKFTEQQVTDRLH